MRSDRLHGFWMCLLVLLGGVASQSASAKVHAMIVADTMSVMGAAAQGYKALFSEFSGTICACGSTAGAVAYCSQRGHLFTEALWWSVHREALQERPGWDMLLARCAKRLELLQTPYFEVLHYPD